MSGRRGFALLVVLIGACAGGESGAKETSSTIRSGARSISAAEAAITFDVLTRSEHAVILIDETENLERSRPKNNEVSYHRRIKILASDARGLADIEIPFSRKQISRWWGFTIQPDGELLELPFEMLSELRLISAGKKSITVTRGALAGVRPGSVVDYGWAATTDAWYAPGLVQVQQPYPVNVWRYRWVTTGLGARAYALNEGAKELGLQATHEANGITIEGREIPPSRLEPFGLPPFESIGALILHYSDDGNGSAPGYWARRAGTTAEHFRQRFADPALFNKVLANLDVDSEASPQQKLRAVYDWLGANFRNLSMLTREEQEQVDRRNEDREVKRDSWLIASRQGTSMQLAELFYGFAKTLGVPADLLYVCDSTQMFFNFNLLSTGQLDSLLVVVIDKDSGKVAYVAPGLGLSFGQSPWWQASGDGLLVTSTGRGKPVFVPPPPADESESSTAVIMTLSQAGTAHAQWTKHGTGQVGYYERRRLREMTPEERKQEVRRLCGESPELAVTLAEPPLLVELTQPYQLRCEGEMLNTQFDLESELLELSFQGPWIDEVPTLEHGPRTQEVILPFPKTETAEIEIFAPEGFAPRTLPDPVRISTSFGEYNLAFEKTGRSYKLKRDFVLCENMIVPNRYPGFVDFLHAILRADQSTLVFGKQNP